MAMFHAILVNDTDGEFDVYLDADTETEAREILTEDWPETRVVGVKTHVIETMRYEVFEALKQEATDLSASEIARMQLSGMSPEEVQEYWEELVDHGE